MGPQEQYLKRIAKDPFLKYFKLISGPGGGSGYQRRVPEGPSGAFKDPGVTRQSADIYKEKTGKTYKGILLPVAKDPTYKTSSFGKADAVKAVAQAKEFRRTASQKTLFGGSVRTLMPSQKRDLSRRKSARKQAEKTKKTLGV